MRSEKVCQEHVNQKQVTELEYENFENLIEKVLILRLRGMMTNLTFHLDLAKFFLSCSETVAWMFFSDCLPVIQQWSRAASHVSLTSTLTHMRDLMKSLASSLISSQQGESNSNSPGNINSYYSHKFLGRVERCLNRGKRGFQSSCCHRISNLSGSEQKGLHHFHRRTEDIHRGGCRR